MLEPPSAVIALAETDEAPERTKDLGTLAARVGVTLDKNGSRTRAGLVCDKESGRDGKR